MDLLKTELPVNEEAFVIGGNLRTGVIMVDIINGFYIVGAGNLVRITNLQIFLLFLPLSCVPLEFTPQSQAPRRPDKKLLKMGEELMRLSRAFYNKKLHVFSFLDTHHIDVPKPPYPSHCIPSTHEANLAPKL
ncbi:unnamed protein product [Linum tenue]|uniref:Uncharacterized protein n=1 Tax=Linum tenue TaxID=586396 RepID=A0AAV0PTK4_9ROSI|nr:unnamed protein product [Linum tenue]